MQTTLSILSFDQGPKFELKQKNDVPEHLFEPPARTRRGVPAAKRLQK